MEFLHRHTRFITFTGTIEAPNPNQRPIRIDIFDGDQQNIGGKRPSVVVSTTVESEISLKYLFQKKTNSYGWVHTSMRIMMVDQGRWIRQVGTVATHLSGSADHKSITIQLGIPNDAPP